MKVRNNQTDKEPKSECEERGVQKSYTGFSSIPDLEIFTKSGSKKREGYLLRISLKISELGYLLSNIWYVLGEREHLLG